MKNLYYKSYNDYKNYRYYNDYKCYDRYRKHYRRHDSCCDRYYDDCCGYDRKYYPYDYYYRSYSY